MSDIDTRVADSLKALDPAGPAAWRGSFLMVVTWILGFYVPRGTKDEVSSYVGLNLPLH